MRAGRVVATTTPRDQPRRSLPQAMVGEPVAPPRIATRAAPARRRRCSRRAALVGPRSARACSGSGRSISTFSPARSSASPASAATARTNSSPASAGLAAPSPGNAQLRRRDMTQRLDAAFRAAGIGYVSADRAEEGLCLDRVAPRQFHRRPRATPPFSRGGVLRLRRSAQARASALDEALRALSAPDRSRRAASPAAISSAWRSRANSSARRNCSSPRNRRAASTSPAPRSSIAEIAAFRDRGGAVLLVSEALDEILALSDRIVASINGALRRRAVARPRRASRRSAA